MSLYFVELGDIMKTRLELIEITEASVYGSNDWRAGITCIDEDGNHWALTVSGSSITDVAVKAQSVFEDRNNWDMYGFLIED